jgi:hypothetical protein
VNRGGIEAVFFHGFGNGIDINLAVAKDDGVFAASPSLWIRSRKSLRFSVPSRSLREPLNMITDWVMFSDVVAWRATSTRSGAERNVLVIRSISGRHCGGEEQRLAGKRRQAEDTLDIRG